MERKYVIIYLICSISLVVGLVGLLKYYVERPTETNSRITEQTYPDNSTQTQSNTIKWTEQDRIDSEKTYNQLKSKFEKKVQSLGYTKVSSISVGDLNGNYATLYCPIKKGGDKVYTLMIFFKKYTEFEIIKVELWDEGNMTKMQLE